MHELSRVMGWELLSPKFYQLPELPAQINTADLMVICVSAFVICTLASILPAYRASRLQPVEALRYE
jgi:lipoprotein-releasing system permease protein